MTVLDASTDGVDMLRFSAKSLRRKVSPLQYSFRQAGSGDIPRSEDRQANFVMAGVPAPSEERRRARRHAQRLPLTMCVFNQGSCFPAQMVNYSQDGVAAETCHRIRPGTSIHIRIDASQPAAIEKAVFPGFRTTALGEVKWCRILGQGDSLRYIAGIRYYSYY
jgi:hypothetical protein